MKPGSESEGSSMSGFLPRRGLDEVYARELYYRLSETVILQLAHIIYSSYSLPSLLECFFSFLSWTLWL